MAKQMVVKMSVNYRNGYLVHILANPLKWEEYKRKQETAYSKNGWKVTLEKAMFMTMQREDDTMTFSFEMVEVLDL